MCVLVQPFWIIKTDQIARRCGLLVPLDPAGPPRRDGRDRRGRRARRFVVDRRSSALVPVVDLLVQWEKY